VRRVGAREMDRAPLWCGPWLGKQLFTPHAAMYSHNGAGITKLSRTDLSETEFCDACAVGDGAVRGLGAPAQLVRIVQPVSQLPASTS
jgi:hypothetical protein